MSKSSVAGAAVATPLNADSSINYDCLTAHGTLLLNSGLDSLTLFGSTGEGSSFSLTERLEAIERVNAAGITPAQLGTGVFNLASASAGEEIKASVAAGCGHILLAPPSYFKGVDDNGLYRWFSEAVDAAGSSPGKIILYHIPGMTQVELSADLVNRLSEKYPGVITSVKDSSGNWTYTERLINECGHLSILVGHEGHLANGMQIGASGSISGSSNFLPELIRTVVHDANQPANLPKLIDAMLTFPIIPAVKALTGYRLNNPHWNRVKSPLSPLTDEQTVALTQSLDRLFPPTST